MRFGTRKSGFLPMGALVSLMCDSPNLSPDPGTFIPGETKKPDILWVVQMILPDRLVQLICIFLFAYLYITCFVWLYTAFVAKERILIQWKLSASGQARSWGQWTESKVGRELCAQAGGGTLGWEQDCPDLMLWVKTGGWGWSTAV